MSDLPRLLDVPGVMTHLHLGRSKVYELIGSGQLRSIKVGSRRLVTESALAGYIASLIPEPAAPCWQSETPRVA